MDTLETLTVVAAVAVFVSFPLMLALDRRIPAKIARAVRLCASALGILLAVICTVLFFEKVAGAPENVAGWARDFFCGYLKISAISTAAATLLLWLGNRIGTPAAFVRSTLAVLIPAVLIMSGAVCAGAASGGYFNVSAYIRATGVTLALATHISSVIPEKKV